MPVHIEQLTQEVTVGDGDLPLSDAQVMKLVKLVLEQLERKQREAQRVKEATALRPQAAPRSSGWE
jgi:hypothetical protein